MTLLLFPSIFVFGGQLGTKFEYGIFGIQVHEAWGWDVPPNWKRLATLGRSHLETSFFFNNIIVASCMCTTFIFL